MNHTSRAAPATLTDARLDTDEKPQKRRQKRAADRRLKNDPLSHKRLDRPRKTMACRTSAWRFLAAMVLLSGWAFSGSIFAGDAVPKVVFTKSFPGSVPAWYSVTIDQTGAAEYREDPKDDSPIKFHLSEADTGQIFDLAAKLDHFKRKLESPAKVAHMGDKTLHYENGAESSETTFNFTEDPDGRMITDWFERISETERHLIDLQRVVKYDKLGVNDALLQLEITLDHKRLIAPEQFLPMLDRVVKNESFMHLARERAANIASQIRSAK